MAECYDVTFIIQTHKCTGDHCNVLVITAGGRATVEEGVSLGRFLRDLQGHIMSRVAHGATERTRDRRV